MISPRVPFSYRALQAWARTAIRVVYRHTEVTGAENVPTDRPAILAANHSNALADIAIIVAKLPQFPRFLAAASWWKSVPARVLFRIGGVVPIYRSRDGVDTRHNRSTFDACYRALASGAHIAIFPEGEMHLEPSLMRLRTGTARIALGAATEAAVRGVSIVPVGIVYEDRGRFRSDVEIHFGDPIAIDERTEAMSDDPRQAARDVTDLLAERLARVTVNHTSNAEADVVDRAAALATSDGAAPQSFARRNRIRRSIAAGLQRSAGESGSAYRDLAAAVDAHGADLAGLGLSANHGAPTLAPASAEDRTRLAVELALLAPPAALGLVAGAPIAIGAFVASTRADESWKATTKGVAGTALCPLVWSLEYAYLARRMGRRRAAALTAAGAVGGLASLAWHDRFQRLRAIQRLDRAEREQPAQLAAARTSRELLREQICKVTAESDYCDSSA